MIKKILVLALCIAFSDVICAYAFDDVQSEDEYYNQITSLTDDGIINGYGDNTFKPLNSITRGEFSKILCRALNINECTGKTFSDIAADSWTYKYADALCSAGIIDGFEDGTFRPNDSILFKDAVKMVVCAMGFADEAENKGGYPHGYIKIAAAKCYLSDISANGAAEITRGQTAALIYNARDTQSD